MPAIESPYHPHLICWSRRGDHRCTLTRGHLGQHKNRGLKWSDDSYADGAQDVETKGRL